MSKKLIFVVSMVNVLDLGEHKTCSCRLMQKAGLFRYFVLAVLLLVTGSLLTATPAAYGQGMYALEVNGAGLTIDDDDDALLDLPSSFVLIIIIL